MAISKAVRQAVYEKFGGRCAYCGREIKYQDMQVDHFIAKNGYSERGSDDISNLMPSCRMCNHYKRANTLETFRRYIQEIPRKLRENYIYKVGVAYGNIVERQKPIFFYFEGKEQQTNADRIRAMSDEELAAVLEIWAKNGTCINSTQRSCDGCPLIPLCRDCKEGYELNWLRQPIKDGEG